MLNEFTKHIGDFKTIIVGGTGGMIGAILIKGQSFLQILLSTFIGMFMAIVFTPAVIHLFPAFDDLENAISAVLGITGQQLIMIVLMKLKDGTILNFITKYKK